MSKENDDLLAVSSRLLASYVAQVGNGLTADEAIDKSIWLAKLLIERCSYVDDVWDGASPPVKKIGRNKR